MGETRDLIEEKGTSFSFKSTSGLMSVSTPHWKSPMLHPISMFRVLGSYYSTWAEFKAEFPELYNVSSAPLRIDGADITDAFYILFGGRQGLDEAKRYCVTYIKKNYKKVIKISEDDEDDMIEHCWKELGLGKDLRKIVKFISNSNYYNKVLRQCLEFLFDKA